MHNMKIQKKMKILLCIPSLALGGAEKFVADLASRIDQSKFDVVVALTRDNSQTVFRDQLQKSNVRIVDLSSSNYFGMCIKQYSFLIKEQPDVIHANVGAILHVLFVSLFFPRIKKFYTVHNEPYLLYHGSYVKKMIYKFAFTWGRFLPVGISKTIQDKVIDDFQLRPEKTRVVNNGVDTKVYSTNKVEKNTDKIQIITTGRLHKVKNHQQLIKVFCDLVSVEPNLHLVILGEGETRDLLENQINVLGLNNYVSMPGMKKNVSEYLQRSDIYVSTSLTEGVPLSILEAMSCGLPVVATDVGGTKDFVENGVNGYLIEKNDDEALFDAMYKLITSENMRFEMGHKAHETSQRWDIAHCAEGYEMLYEEESI